MQPEGLLLYEMFTCSGLVLLLRLGRVTLAGFVRGLPVSGVLSRTVLIVQIKHRKLLNHFLVEFMTDVFEIPFHQIHRND